MRRFILVGLFGLSGVMTAYVIHHQRLPKNSVLMPMMNPTALQVSTTPWLNEPVVDPVPAETLLHGATVQYYEVDGNTIEQLKESMAAEDPGHTGAQANTLYHLVLHKGDPSDGVCGFSRAFIEAEVTVLMPRWVLMPQASDEAKQWWSFRIRDIATQQQAHIDMALKEAQDATLEIGKADCASGDAMYGEINNRLTAAHAQTSYAAVGSDVQFQTPGAVVEAVSAKPVPMTRGQNSSIPRSQRTTMDFSHIDLRTLDGVQSALEDQKGRVIFLNFWATWCSPCRNELPSLASLYGKFKDQNIFFAFSSTNETAGALRSFFSRSHFDLPVYMASTDTARPDLVHALPTTIIISKKGEIALQRTGQMDWDTPGIAKLLTDLENE